MLYIIPTPIASDGLDTIPDFTLDRIRQIDYFIVERLRTARRFVRSADHPLPVSELRFEEFNEDSPDSLIPEFFDDILKGRACGILSEAGCPGIADPGARLVAYAHHCGIPVRPLPGPSSIFLALMGSGLSGQHFCFHGYLPAKRTQQKQALLTLEKQTLIQKQPQIFMETPYRNRQVLDLALEVLKPDTLFCVAAGLLSSKQYILTKSMVNWRKTGFPDIHKVPAIFLIGTPGMTGPGR